MDKLNDEILSCFKKNFFYPLSPRSQYYISANSHWYTSKTSPATLKRGRKGYMEILCDFLKIFCPWLSPIFRKWAYDHLLLKFVLGNPKLKFWTWNECLQFITGKAVAAHGTGVATFGIQNDSFDQKQG